MIDFSVNGVGKLVMLKKTLQDFVLFNNEDGSQWWIMVINTDIIKMLKNKLNFFLF